MRQLPVIAAMALVVGTGALAGCAGDSGGSAASTPSASSAPTASAAVTTAAPTTAVASTTVAPASTTAGPASSAVDSTTTSTHAATTTTAPPTTEATTGDTMPPPTGPQASTPFCQATVRADAASRYIDELDTTAATHDQIVAAYEQWTTAANAAFDAAPGELARATSIMKSVFNQVAALMVEHDYDRQATFNDPRYEDLNHQTEQPEVVAANEDYETYLNEQCGIGG